jgi:hypothetical protein
VAAGIISEPPLGVKEKPTPLQVTPLKSEIVALGLIVTVSVNGAPTQFPLDPEVGVTVYTTCCATLVLLVNV